MKIAENGNSVNFKSTPIHNVNLKSADNTFVKAVFSELNPANYTDGVAVSKIKKAWKNPDDAYICAFHDEFLGSDAQNYKYSAIELPGKEPLSDRVIGLSAASFVERKNLYIDLILVKTELKAQQAQRKIKNIGEVILGSLFNVAKKANSNELSFLSANNAFYHKTFGDAGISPEELPCEFFSAGKDFSNFYVKKTDIEKYVRYCEKKFNMEFPKD